jgi:hypothetical protein
MGSSLHWPSWPGKASVAGRAGHACHGQGGCTRAEATPHHAMDKQATRVLAGRSQTVARREPGRARTGAMAEGTARAAPGFRCRSSRKPCRGTMLELALLGKLIQRGSGKSASKV